MNDVPLGGLWSFPSVPIDMKHTTLLFAFSLFAVIAKANTSLQERLQLPLYVILSDSDNEINKQLRTVVDGYWDLNDVEYISEADNEELSWTAANCFLVYQKNQSVEDNGTTVFSEVLRIVAFTKNGKLVENIAGSPILSSDGINRATNLVNAVKLLQDKLQFALYKDQGDSEFASYSQKIDAESSIVKLKKLYISSQDLDEGLDYASIPELYKGEVKIVDKSYIDKLVEEGSGDAVYVIVNKRQTSGFTYVNTKMIVDAASGALVYRDETTSTSPKGFSKKDFKKLAD